MTYLSLRNPVLGFIKNSKSMLVVNRCPTRNILSLMNCLIQQKNRHLNYYYKRSISKRQFQSTDDKNNDDEKSDLKSFLLNLKDRKISSLIGMSNYKV